MIIKKLKQETEAAYKLWEDGKATEVSPEVLIYGVQELDKGEDLWRKLQETPSPENEPLYRALASSEDPLMINKLLKGVFSSDGFLNSTLTTTTKIYE